MSDAETRTRAVQIRMTDGTWRRWVDWCRGRHGGRGRIARGRSWVAVELEALVAARLEADAHTHTPPPPRAGRIPPELVADIRGRAQDGWISHTQLRTAITAITGVSDARSVQRWIRVLRVEGVVMVWTIRGPTGQLVSGLAAPRPEHAIEVIPIREVVP